MKARAEASERLSDEIVASLTSGLLVVDFGGIVRTLNPAGRRLLGLPDADWTRPYGEVLGGAPELAALIDECLAEAQPVVRRTVRTVAGGATHLGVTVSPIRDEAGHAYGAICLFTDLSEIMDLEDQLRLKDSLARLGELTAGIAHEFRNGLATIHGYARLLDLERLPRGLPSIRDGDPLGDRGARPGRHQLPELRQADAADRGAGRHGRRWSSAPPTTSGRTCRRAAASSSFAASSARSMATTCCCDRRSAISSATRSRPAWAPASRRASPPTAVDRSRSEDAARGGQRQRARNPAGDCRADVPALLHDQGARHRSRARAGAEVHRHSQRPRGGGGAGRERRAPRGDAATRGLGSGPAGAVARSAKAVCSLVRWSASPLVRGVSQSLPRRSSHGFDASEGGVHKLPIAARLDEEVPATSPLARFTRPAFSLLIS